MAQHEGPTAWGDTEWDAQTSLTRIAIIFGLASAVMLVASGLVTYAEVAGHDFTVWYTLDFFCVCAIPGWLYALAAWCTAHWWTGPSANLGVFGVLASIAGVLLSAAGFLILAAFSGCHDFACLFGSVPFLTFTVIPFFLSLVGTVLGLMGVIGTLRWEKKWDVT